MAMNRSRISSSGFVILGVVDILDVQLLLSFWRKDDDQEEREAKEWPRNREVKG